MSNIYNLQGISTDLLNNLGGVKISQVNNKFHEDIRLLLETKKGTVIGDPSFGSNLHTLLYEPANEATGALIRQEIANTIEKFYNNLIIDNVDITFKTNTVQVSIYYKLYNSNIGDTIMLEFLTGNID